MDITEVLADLEAEQEALDAVVADLPAKSWQIATASPRWAVRHQIAHLAYFDHAAALAITEPEAFKASASELFSHVDEGAEAIDQLTVGLLSKRSASELLADWRANRLELSTAAATLENDSRVVWYGPSMGSKSFLTARLMECWAHGQDIVDAVGATRSATDRIRHIAQLGYITRGWSYANRGLDVPAEPVRVRLHSPSGQTWTFGPQDATETVAGSAEEFCLVVTQRRKVGDTALTATPIAMDWLEIAQAFAGPAT
ncbi:MAG: TIGR03084 family protein [Acidimicrobiales bacterium]|nr:TIGR03084 family protein [Acidimicrobiales bacterium]